MAELDSADRRILDALQDNGRLSLVELAAAAGLSPSQCGRRLKRLEEAGVIVGYAALLNEAHAGLGVVAFVTVSLETHGAAQADAFRRAVEARANVLECWSVSGEYDYLLRVVATDLQAFSDWMMHDLLTIPNVANIHSTIALDRIKQTTRLPL